MIQLTILSITMIISIIFFNMIHPLAMGLTLLVQTLMICLMTGLIAKSFWFSYILFLIFLGGMLVLFIYVTSLASNEMFSMSLKLIILSLMIMMITIIVTINIDNNLLMYWSMNNEMNSIFNMDSFLTENSLMLNKLYNFPNNLITIMLMNYLLITLVAIVKITKLSKGPLRLMI